MPNFSVNMNEETICDHFVSSDVKKVWSVQLEMLEEIERICKKYNLRYFASGGTLLGAVRHQGYIPWDDDIDIHMLASDYNKFCKIAPKELKASFFWQDYRTQPGYGVRHGKIRNSNTTGCTDWEAHY